MKSAIHTILQTLALGLGLTLALSAYAQPKPPKAPPPPPPPTVEGVTADVGDLESLVDHWEKDLTGSTDADRRGHAHQILLLKAGNLAGQIAHLQNLYKQATKSGPKNDATGGLTIASSESQAANLAKLAALEKRLKALRERIDALEKPPGKVAGPGPAPGAGAGGKTTTTTSAGDPKTK